MALDRDITLGTVNIAGLTAAAEALGATPDRARAAVEAALYQEGEDVMADSKANYVPVDLGTLRDSGFVDPPVWEGDTLVVQLGYGGAAEAYALAVHEHLSDASPPSWRTAEARGHPVQFHPPGHGPKYLETPVLQAAQGLEARLAARIRQQLEGGR